MRLYITQYKDQGYPCGNFSDTPSLKLIKTKGSIGHAFTVCIHTENQNQVSLYPFVLHEIYVLIELTLGHLRYHLTVVPPQPNSQPDSVKKKRERPLVQQEIENLVAPMQQVLSNFNNKDKSSATVGCISCELDAPLRGLFRILDATKGHACLNYKSGAVCVQIS